jgi:hypothetical protein
MDGLYFWGLGCLPQPSRPDNHVRSPLYPEVSLISRTMQKGAWVAGGLVLLVLAALLLMQYLGAGALLPISAVIAAPPVGDLPMMPEKPPASPEGFKDCPPEGQGGDVDLNRLLNRVDKGAYVPVSFDSLLALTWPRSAEQHLMIEWTPSGRAFISQYLGVPVVVEGYIEALRDGVPHAANCSRTDEPGDLWRLYLTKGPKDRRAQSVIAVSTPQTRVGHTWTVDMIRSFLVAGRVPVRLSGWLYFDPDHSQEIGRTRATLWEISPVMQIEVFQDGRWNPLDKYGK